MGSERGLPPIPRGVGTELANYLRAMHEVVLRLSGLVRGSKGSRALRVSDGSATTGTSTASIGQASVLTRHLADKTVTGAKLADGSVTDEKLAASAVTERAIRAGAVTEAALAPESVTGAKLADGVLPVWMSGAATHGEVISLPGVWAVAPVVAVTAFCMPQASDEENEEQEETPLMIGVSGLHEVVDDAGQGTGAWEFTATGDFAWAAIGYAR